jgi:type I restriction-modification system DNA methylase subunit
MADLPLDLISMADIARLAGEKRATVGNWKARKPEEFPPERGRGPRGPLYDRAEVIAWLKATNRLKARSPEVATMWNLANSFRGAMSTEDVAPLLLALLAVKSKAPGEWSRLEEASVSPNLDDAVRSALHSAFPFAHDVLPVGRVPVRALHDAVTTLTTLDDRLVGELADALLEQAASAMGHRGGEFLTPRSVRKLIVAISEPTGTVYNPGTGVAQLMIDAAINAADRPVHLFGEEINARTWAMARLNLAVHDVEADVALGDVFNEDAFPQLRADRVLCVPPWNQRLPIVDALFNDPRWVFGEPGPNDGNMAWTQHCLAHLADNGRAVIVLPNAALFQSGRAGRIRQRIVKAGLLDAVFALPGGLFAWTGLPCSVLVFAKGRRGDDRPAPTLMVDIAKSQEPQGARGSSISDEVIDDSARLHRDWTKGKEPTVDYAAVATFDDLSANDFVIDPGRYLSLPRTTLDIPQATRARAHLVDRLASLTRASREADAELKAILGESQ